MPLAILADNGTCYIKGYSLLEHHVLQTARK
jgi:hypothetical protein